MTCETDNSQSNSMSEGGSANSDSEYYEDDGTDGTNAAGAEMNHCNPHNLRMPRRQSIHMPLPSTFQHYGSFYLRMGAVGTLNSCVHLTPSPHHTLRQAAFLTFVASRLPQKIIIDATDSRAYQQKKKKNKTLVFP